MSIGFDKRVLGFLLLSSVLGFDLQPKILWAIESDEEDFSEDEMVIEGGEFDIPLHRIRQLVAENTPLKITELLTIAKSEFPDKNEKALIKALRRAKNERAPVREKRSSSPTSAEGEGASLKRSRGEQLRGRREALHASRVFVRNALIVAARRVGGLEKINRNALNRFLVAKFPQNLMNGQDSYCNELQYSDGILRSEGFKIDSAAPAFDVGSLDLGDLPDDIASRGVRWSAEEEDFLLEFIRENPHSAPMDISRRILQDPRRDSILKPNHVKGRAIQQKIGALLAQQRRSLGRQPLGEPAEKISVPFERNVGDISDAQLLLGLRQPITREQKRDDVGAATGLDEEDGPPPLAPLPRSAAGYRYDRAAAAEVEEEDGPPPLAPLHRSAAGYGYDEAAAAPLHGSAMGYGYEDATATYASLPQLAGFSPEWVSREESFLKGYIDRYPEKSSTEIAVLILSDVTWHRDVKAKAHDRIELQQKIDSLRSGERQSPRVSPPSPDRKTIARKALILAARQLGGLDKVNRSALSNFLAKRYPQYGKISPVTLQSEATRLKSEGFTVDSTHPGFNADDLDLGALPETFDAAYIFWSVKEVDLLRDFMGRFPEKDQFQLADLILGDQNSKSILDESHWKRTSIAAKIVQLKKK